MKKILLSFEFDGKTVLTDLPLAIPSIFGILKKCLPLQHQNNRTHICELPRS